MHRMLRRLRVVRLTVSSIALTGLVLLSSCASPGYPQDVAYKIAGGNSSGVYYRYAEQLAASANRSLGIDITAEESRGSVENLERVASGEAILGFAQGDTAADALAGNGSFEGALDVCAVARVYDEFVHVVVPADSPLQRIEDLAGHTVSLGAESSGVQVISTRVLDAVGVDRVTVRGLGLGDSIAAMQRGELDAFFWVGGLPTPGIEELATQLPIRLLSIDAGTVERVNEGHAGVYQLGEFSTRFYGLSEPTVTMTVPNYLVTSCGAPSQLINNLTRELFNSRANNAKKVTAAGYLDRRQAIFTGPLELHPGAAEYYVDTRK